MKKIIQLALVLISLFSMQAFALIEAGRVLQITIQGVPSSEKVRVDAAYPVSDSGMINMPFIGQIKASGLQEDTLSRLIESKYKQGGYYTTPTIQVMQGGTGDKGLEKTLTVGGQVARPGQIPYTRDLTLYQAVATAGGPTAFGNMKKVKVFRNGQQQVYDLTNASMMEIRIAPNDTIEVPHKSF